MKKYLGWNPWHGCHRVSEGCRNCWLFYLDSAHNVDTNEIFRSKSNFDLPIKKDRNGAYKIPPGTQLGTCFNTDFLLKEADEWRGEAWALIRRRPDIEFLIPTKRISRLLECLPPDWGDGWSNVFIAVSVEDQRAAQERIPELLNSPLRKRGLFLSPLLEDIDLANYLKSNLINYVSVGGESYPGARECRFEWVQHIKSQCDQYKVQFDYHQTGTNFVYKGKKYCVPHDKEYEQAKRAFKDELKQ